MKHLFFIVILFLHHLLNCQITANNHFSTKETNYTDGSKNDSIYIWQGKNNGGSLSYIPTQGNKNYVFNWYIYSSETFSWNTFITQFGSSSKIENLSDGGYRVETYNTEGVLIGCDVAWVWNVNNETTAINNKITCTTTKLIGDNKISKTSFTYYNPQIRQSIVNKNTVIKVCFTGKHTYVSDLGFFLIGPENYKSPVVTLSPNPGANGQGAICNGGNNFNELCFTNEPSPNFNVCTSKAPLTGTYSSYGSNPGTNIDFSPIYGTNAAQGGWRVQVFDCISADVGKLTSATLSFSNLTSVCGSPTTITYTSGILNSPINDNSCSQIKASIYKVPPPLILTTPIIFNPKQEYEWTTSNPIEITNVNSLNAYANNVKTKTVFTLKSHLIVDQKIISTSTAQTTFEPTKLNGYFGITNPTCFDSCNGILSVTPTTGTEPYTYTWTPSGDTQTISNLCSGEYSVIVTDINGCTIEGTITLIDPDQLILTPIIHN